MSGTKKASLAKLAIGAGAAFLTLRRLGDRDRAQLARLKPDGVAVHAKGDDVGADADAPSDIPPRGWWQIAKRAVAKFGENELMSEAAAVTFYALLSLVPAITALVSLYGLVSDPSSIAKQLDQLAGVVPSGGMQIIDEQVKRLTQTPASGLSTGLIVGLATALWSANAATKSMFSALNDVYGEHETRSFLRITATSLILTVGGIVTMITGLVLLVALPAIFKAMGLDTAFALAIRIGRLPIMLAVIVAALAILFRYGPDRHPPKWRWVTWGGALAGIGWVAVSLGFSWYVTEFGSYNKTYGSLGAVIGFMTWIWISTTVLLLGAQINAELEEQTTRETAAET